MLASQRLPSASYTDFCRVLSQVELQSLPSLARVQDIQQIRYSTFVLVEEDLCAVKGGLSRQETWVLLKDLEWAKDQHLPRLYYHLPDKPVLTCSRYGCPDFVGHIWKKAQGLHWSVRAGSHLLSSGLAHIWRRLTMSILCSTWPRICVTAKQV